MKVSVVMAAYDAELHVHEAVASVLDQTHDDWELIVVDDGSHDDTVAIVESFADPRVRIVRREHCGVLGQVRNAGIAVADGQAIAFLDADDRWLPSKLARQTADLAAHPDVGVSYTWADLLVDDARRRGPRPKPEGQLVRALLRNNFVFSSSALVRASLLDRTQAFDPDPELGGSPDYDLWLRLAGTTRFSLVEEPLVLYRVHPGQMSGASARMQRSALVAVQKLAARSTDVDRADVALALGMRRQLAGERGRGRRDLLRSLLLRPSVPALRWLARSFVAQRRATAS